MSNWMSILEEMELVKKLNIIFVSRRSISVARSLQKRNALPLEDGVRLWEIYTNRAINFCESHDIPTIYLSFEKILKNPLIQCEKLFNFLSCPFDKSVVKSFVDKSISKNSEGRSIELPGSILDLENKIEKLTLM